MDSQTGEPRNTFVLSSMRIISAGLSDTGRQREHNEDSFCILSDFGVFAVADGMGGHRAGDIASNIATREISNFFKLNPEESAWPADYDDNKSLSENKLITCIQLANKKIFGTSIQSRDVFGMGTTIVSAFYDEEEKKLHIAHVGDSRAYRIRAANIAQLTRDHSLLNDYLSVMPTMTEEQLADLPKNVITRALGMQDIVNIDTVTDDPKPQDIYLLCSDGLTGMLSDEEILTTVGRAGDNLKDAVRALIDSANEQGGEDNITAVLFSFRE
jgi:protein phosphatase